MKLIECADYDGECEDISETDKWYCWTGRPEKCCCPFFLSICGTKKKKMLPCPFCGKIPDLPDGSGTQYEIECDCGMSRSCVQISDLMTIEERMSDPFLDCKYEVEFIEHAKNEAIKKWNNRS